MRMAERRVIVTGGASGIGEATVRDLVIQGARVIIADLDDERGPGLAEELGEQVTYQRTDVADEDSVTALFDAAEATLGGVDGLFNNAGIGHIGPSAQHPLTDWQRVIDINLTGAFLVAKHAIARMEAAEGGAIVNCASILGNFGQSQTAAYSAAKGGVVNLTRTLALEYARKGIRVNTVSPGYIITPLLDALDQETKDYLAGLHAMGRMGQPEEVARAVTFLLSDEASFITGSQLLVDGGFTAGKS